MALRAFLNGAVFAEVHGSGPPEVLALHGWGRRGSDFAPALEGLDAVAPDLPGFGVSPAPDRVIGAEGYADLISDMLDVFERPPVVMGHSFGGRVAVCLAANHPERVGPLVLSGVPLVRLASPRRPSQAFRLARMLNRVGLLGDVTMERMRRRRGSADYRASTGMMRDILVKVVNESYEKLLPSIASPVHLLWGEDDRDVPVAVAEASLPLLAHATLETLPGVGHMVPLEAPGSVRAAIGRALL